MKTFLFAILFLFSVPSFAQTANYYVTQMGFYPSGHYDTIPVKVFRLHPKLDVVFFSDGFVVRERYDYRGDRMPTGDYRPYFSAVRFLTANKDTLAKDEDILNKEINSKEYER